MKNVRHYARLSGGRSRNAVALRGCCRFRRAALGGCCGFRRVPGDGHARVGVGPDVCTARPDLGVPLLELGFGDAVLGGDVGARVA